MKKILHIIFLVFFLTVPSFWGPAFAQNADTAFDQKQIELLQHDSSSAQNQAAKLRKQAAQYRELAESAERYAADASDIKNKEEWQKTAREHREKAEKLEQKAAQEDGKSAGTQDRVDTLHSEIEKKEEIAREKQEKYNREAAQIAEREAAKQKAIDENPNTGLRVGNVIGLWRDKAHEDEPFAIVQKDPNSKAYPNRLQAHTPRRVWEGDFHTDPPPGEPLITMSYKPKAEEMNPEIPEWARKKIEGELEWKLEINGGGTCGTPALSVDFYPGEVKWEEKEGWGFGKGKVSIEGKGDARRMDFHQSVPDMRFYSYGNARLYLRPPGLQQGKTDAEAAATSDFNEYIDTVDVQTAKEPEFDGDILAEKNGGTLVYAPNDEWQFLNKDHEKFTERSGVGATYSGEAVWSFKDGKPATFDQVEVLVPKAYDYTLKTFEILAADELAGPYKSLGEFTVQNVKVQPKGWQGFKFPETKARFVKIVFKDGYGGYINGNALRLKGKIDESAPATEKKAAVDGIDVLAQKNGGTLVYAPNDKWKTINTDKFERPTYAGEAVWGFKDGKPATFDRIEILSTQTEDYNLKTFEVLAGDDSEGAFKSLGEFTLMNHKVLPDGWQTFTFPSTTARYVKVIFKEGYGGYIGGNAMRLIGKIDESASAAEKPAAIEGTNLLAQSAGGTLLVSPNDEWQKLNDGKEERTVTRTGQGVWAFNGEKPAMIEAIDVLVPERADYTLKEFEVLVGDEGPTGTFKSLGIFTVQNRKVMPDGWQRFTFPKAMAKYVKIDCKEGYGGYIATHEFRVIGNLAE